MPFLLLSVVCLIIQSAAERDSNSWSFCLWHCLVVSQLQIDATKRNRGRNTPRSGTTQEQRLAWCRLSRELCLFNSNIKPVLFYGPETWRTTKNLLKLHVLIINKSLRGILNIRCFTRDGKEWRAVEKPQQAPDWAGKKIGMDWEHTGEPTGLRD